MTDRDQTIYFTRHGEGYHQGEPKKECENIRDAGDYYDDSLRSFQLLTMLERAE